ncbi:MAG TPA: CRISPR-associated endonuclease Cas1, partial [Pirellulaceae bacterium]|nr:CRISPR-associated endonuclease Cas1 [Pirellulaceae bacterium]
MIANQQDLDGSAPDETAGATDYLPARMLNEFVYCPRLFYYEWVERVFAHNRETVEGALRHSKLDAGSGELDPADVLAETGEKLHSRSVTLSSDAHRLIAKLDLVETEGRRATPVDYKRGGPREDRETGEISAWDADKAQLAAQALVLRDNGYDVDEAIVYYVKTKQRVRIAIDDGLLRATVEQLNQARETAAAPCIPPPLIDSPKCPRCSLVGICLPDETRSACGGRAGEGAHERQRVMFDVPATPEVSVGAARDDSDEVRRLIPARDDLRPLYVNTHGLTIGKSGNVLRIKEKDKVVQDVRIGEICQLNIYGNIQITTQALQALCENEVPIAYFSQGGWFYGITQALGVKNIRLRQRQFQLAESPAFCLRLAQALTAGKIRNQRTLLQRNHIEPPAGALAMLKCLGEQVMETRSLGELLGVEGNAARVYFENFAGMIKGEEEDPFGEPGARPPEFRFDFTCRNRRPPRDPVNALLSLAYSVLAKDCTIAAQAAGFDPFQGYYHQPRFGRASLALDLMEPFRPLIADSAVLTAINTRMVTPGDFVRAGASVALTPSGRRAFFRAYEQRMDTLVTHPRFGYRVNYRRLL